MFGMSYKTPLTSETNCYAIALTNPNGYHIYLLYYKNRIPESNAESYARLQNINNDDLHLKFKNFCLQYGIKLKGVKFTSSPSCQRIFGIAKCTETDYQLLHDYITEHILL